MIVKVLSCSDADMWYVDCIGMEFVVFPNKEYYLIPIPFEYLKTFYPYLILLKQDCEVVEGG